MFGIQVFSLELLILSYPLKSFVYLLYFVVILKSIQTDFVRNPKTMDDNNTNNNTNNNEEEEEKNEMIEKAMGKFKVIQL